MFVQVVINFLTVNKMYFCDYYPKRTLYEAVK